MAHSRTINLDAQIKSAKLMTADSNFEIRRLGAELLFNLGDNAIGCLTSFTWTVLEALAGEKIPDIRAIHNQAIVG